MKRSVEWSHQWLLHLTAALLFAAVFLRSVLLYRGNPQFMPVVLLLFAWLILYVSETTLEGKWPGRFSWYFSLYLLIQVLLTLALLLRPNSSDIYAILFCILSMQVMQHSSLRAGEAWIGTFSILTVLPLIQLYGIANGIAFALIYAAANVLLGFYSLATRRADEAREQNQALAHQLGEANGRLQSYSKSLEELAVSRERQRFARELHDSVTQTLFSMTLTTQSAALVLERDPAKVGAQLDRLNYLAQNALSEMRVLIAELDTGKIKGTLSDRLCAHLADRQLPDDLSVTIEAEGSLPLSLAQEQGLFRIAQEAVNNIVKHARATHACIRLHLAEPLWMEIQDDGVGFDLEGARSGGRVGLSSMQERAAEIGWELRIITGLGAGTCVRVDKPQGVGRG